MKTKKEIKQLGGKIEPKTIPAIRKGKQIFHKEIEKTLSEKIKGKFKEVEHKHIEYLRENILEDIGDAVKKVKEEEKEKENGLVNCADFIHGMRYVLNIIDKHFGSELSEVKE